MNEQIMSSIEKMANERGIRVYPRKRTLAFVRSHATKGRNKKAKKRIWWLAYGRDILCPNCKFCVIRIEEAWCGCRPIPRKLKKWCKGRRAAYLETM